MIKLLYITNNINGPGGLERVLSIKASYLAEHFDYEVHILTLNQKEVNPFYEFNSKIQYHNIYVSGNPINYLRKYTKGLNTMVKKINPTVISVCDDGLKGFFVPLIIKKPCPMIYERHVSKNIENQRGKQSWLNKLSSNIKFGLMNLGGKHYDNFIVLTKGNLNEWKFKKLKVIPNPLSFYPEKQSLQTNKKVLAVGKQSFQKGYDRLLKSWKQVVKKHPNWTLDIYGKYSENEGLEKLADDLDILDSVHFYPPVKNIGEKYQEASIYTMSSRYEGFGMVLTEAMAYGVPCVSYDCPYGPSDIISDGEDGILVENHDIDKFAEAVIYLIQNEKIRIEMGKKSREAIKQYLPEKIAMQWDTLFKGLINSSSL
ncbi:glycosyltransferase family 4 protein [Aquimarina macrocephali]|uniref:glycosyltransferase family 4 protein n=1 Tax=Aquimarina macrocephali TaxID=666563 RepID=UPI000467A079|nr:glycosyltransferase family 4 protein [Aquimarina macrocephali]